MSADQPSESIGSGRRTRVVVAVALASILVIAASVATGRLTAPADSNPVTSSVEAGFSRDMQVHHGQAVQLAMIVRDATDDADVRLLAYDIATSQSQQSGQMFGWLAEWGLPQASAEPPMTWMTRPTTSGEVDHGGMQPGSTMPGLATRQQVADLSATSGIEAERMFLELMIAHHRGGVEMAEALLDRSSHRVVTALAGGIVRAQSNEIELMERMLAER